MRGRSAALAIAGVLLLAGMIALRCSLASSNDDAATPPPPRTAESAPAQQAAPRPSAPSMPAAPAAPTGSAPASTGPASTAAPNTPSLPDVIQAVTPSGPRKPIAYKQLLRDQVAAVEPQVVECGKQAGDKANGSAVLTYMVTPDHKKKDVAIEQTGVEYDGTTIDSQPLLDCLKDTSKDMRFAYVPDTDGVFALRRVKFDNGKLVENVFVNFHYVR